MTRQLNTMYTLLTLGLVIFRATDTRSEIELLANRPTRIVGGKDAEKGTHPWQVSIHWANPKRGLLPRHICGGSLLKPEWILTAGHCKTLSPSKSPGHYIVLAGKYKLGELEETEQSRMVERTFVYPEYSG